MGESRNAYRVLVGRPEGKRPLGRPRRRWEDNIKMALREVGYDEEPLSYLPQVGIALPASKVIQCACGTTTDCLCARSEVLSEEAYYPPNGRPRTSLQPVGAFYHSTKASLQSFNPGPMSPGENPQYIALPIATNDHIPCGRPPLWSNGEVGSVGRMIEGNGSTRRKTLCNDCFIHHKFHQTWPWDRTRVAWLEDQRVSTSAIDAPRCIIGGPPAWLSGLRRLPAGLKKELRQPSYYRGASRSRWGKSGCDVGKRTVPVRKYDSILKALSSLENANIFLERTVLNNSVLLAICGLGSVWSWNFISRRGGIEVHSKTQQKMRPPILLETFVFVEVHGFERDIATTPLAGQRQIQMERSLTPVSERVGVGGGRKQEKCTAILRAIMCSQQSPCTTHASATPLPKAPLTVRGGSPPPRRSAPGSVAEAIHHHMNTIHGGRSREPVASEGFL
ncbi:hypothetical protein ANN_02500 [Periplaneta americana]|uniref:Uncharacterized protein n=1 Tax=Periplaneta americana TaxID=6978 RepID=A0ABQ8TWP6_PERAM|nr:hypothetical protein ANN_02500 [Periplaneta americana]